ncbi:hypothetical protein [Streptacidiphilus pinicola]|uniref:hypothetical protein n=1 Tax=Streptacidiphilus pinicola TaxID=2219663 RepID=UPI0026C754DF
MEQGAQELDPIESRPPPFVDARDAEIDAAPDTVWRALCAVLDRSFSRPLSARYARLVGVEDPVASGPRPLDIGSTLPGFHVFSTNPCRELVLAGRHRFSSYALTCTLTPTGRNRTRLRATTHAAFPGPGGLAYRLLVVSSGFHRLGMRRLLAAVAAAARDSAEPDELNRAVALYFRRIPAATGADPDLFAAVFGPAADRLAAEVAALKAEAFALDVDETRGELWDWADRVATALRAAHPDLTADSAERIANYWAYCNK